jgi:hypothetical protein
MCATSKERLYLVAVHAPSPVCDNRWGDAAMQQVCWWAFIASGAGLYRAVGKADHRQMQY